MRYLFAVAAFLLVELNALAGDGRFTIDLRQGDNLKVIFDAGLRPWRTPELESISCEVGPTNLTVILPTGETFDTSVEMASFRVFEGNVLSHADFIGKVVNLQDAATSTRKICAALKIPTEDFEKALANVGTWQNPGKSWCGTFEAGGVLCDVIFTPIHKSDRTDAEVNITIGWRRQTKFPLHSSLEPIQPPLGYENVSMKEPPLPRSEEQIPKHDADYYKKQILDRLHLGH
jgi:hypothetical protein